MNTLIVTVRTNNDEKTPCLLAGRLCLSLFIFWCLQLYAAVLDTGGENDLGTGLAKPVLDLVDKFVQVRG